MLTFIAFVVFNAIVIKAECGMPESISRGGFYTLNALCPNAGYTFTIWCYITSILTMILLFELSDGTGYEFLGLLAGGGLALTGAAPNFLTRERSVHYAGASLSAAASILWIVLSGYWGVPVIAGVVAAGCALLHPRSWLYIAECACFMSMYVTVYMMI